MFLHVPFQFKCLGRCILAPITFVRFFSTVCFQMHSQIWGAKRWKLLLHLLVFSLLWIIKCLLRSHAPILWCVSFHVIYLERRKLTLIAFVGLETFVCLHMVSHVLCLERCKLTEGAFVSCAVFSWDASKDENSHWLHLFDFPPLVALRSIFSRSCSILGLFSWTGQSASREFCSARGKCESEICTQFIIDQWLHNTEQHLK